MASPTQWTWFGWTPGVGDGQGGLKYCGSWDHKLSDMTEQLNWTERRWKLIVILGTLWMRMFLVYLLSWLTHGLNQMLRFAFLLNFKVFPLLSSLICCFWEPYYHSDSLSLFWEFFLPFFFYLFFSFEVLGKYFAIFKLGKDAPQFWRVMCLIRYGQSNIIITTFYLLLMGKEWSISPSQWIMS